MATSAGPVPNPVPLSPQQLNYAQTSLWLQLIRQFGFDLRVSSPAILTEDLDPDSQTVSAQIAIREQARTPTGPQWVAISPVLKVPIVIPRGGGCSITLPLKKGNEGLLVFCDTCFDLWWARGGVQNQIPGDHRHEHWDCGFIPGMYSQQNLLSNYSTDSLQVRTDDGDTIIDVSSDGVEITGAKVTAANGGTAQPLVNDTFFQWFSDSIFPFLTGLGYLGPSIPVDSETTILKGQ